MKRFAGAAKVTLALSIAVFGMTVPTARADVFQTYTFVPNSSATLFNNQGLYNIFGGFTIDLTNSTYTSNFWVQAVGANNGNFTTSSGPLPLSPTNAIEGFDQPAGGGNSIVLTFQNPFPTGGFDALTGVSFDGGIYTGSNIMGGVSAPTPEPSLTFLVAGMMICLVGLARVAKRRKAQQH